MVTPFLVINCITNLVFAVTYVYLLQDKQKWFGVLSAVLLGLSSVVLYAGLVLIGRQKGWSGQAAPIGHADRRPDGNKEQPVIVHRALN
jgi:hypothetical protein